MKALVIVESCFGNTEKVAGQIADGLRSAGADADVAYASDPPQIAGSDLLVIGAPTHNRGLPKSASRMQAEERGGHPQSRGVAEWTETLPRLNGQRVAAFGTKVDRSFAGSAAKAIGKRLTKLRADVVGCEDFTVQQGHLADGEAERAEQWGASLASVMRPPA